jgi:hypothetical protein
VARRCEALVRQIRVGEREAFVQGKAEWPGPTGKRFRELAGESGASRKLFAEILKEDSRADVLERAGRSPEEASVGFVDEVNRLTAAGRQLSDELSKQLPTMNPFESMREASRKVIEPGDVVLTLFLATLAKGDVGKQFDSLHDVLSASFIDLARGPLKEPFRKLFVAWLGRQTREEILAEGLEGALYVPMPEALGVARRLAKDSKTSGRVTATAILLLGNQGSVDDLPSLAEFRKDSRPYWGYKGKDDKEMEVQLRDLAVAMSLSVRGEDFQKFGFQSNGVLVWWVGPTTSPYKTLNVFANDGERAAAHDKAWAWLDEKATAEKK